MKTNEGNYGDEGAARKSQRHGWEWEDQPAGVRICHFGPRTRPRKLVLLHPSTMPAAVLAADDDSSLIPRILPPWLTASTADHIAVSMVGYAGSKIRSASTEQSEIDAGGTVQSSGAVNEKQGDAGS